LAVVDRPDHSELVRNSVALAAGEQTAALRFLPTRIHVQPSLDERVAERSPLLGNAMRAAGDMRQQAMTRFQISDIPGPAGRIDFANQRCLYCEDEGQWTLTAPGLEFMGESGEWEQVVADGDARVDHIDPLWLLQLIAGVVEASEDGDEAVLGEPCKRYRTVASFEVASARSKRKMEPPGSRGELDLDRLPIDVWVDAAGRIRRAILHGDRSLMLLELSDFGEPDAIDLPESDEILRDEN
jgi:hypothetical protein